MIHVIATITTKAGQRSQFLSEFKQLVPLVLAEEGCLEYNPALDLDSGIPQQREVRDNCVMVVEKWDNLEALRNHLAAPHMESFRQRTQDMVADLSILVLQPQA